jgi:hypothetical protein
VSNNENQQNLKRLKQCYSEFKLFNDDSFALFERGDKKQADSANSAKGPGSKNSGAGNAAGSGEVLSMEDRLASHRLGDFIELAGGASGALLTNYINLGARVHAVVDKMSSVSEVAAEAHRILLERANAKPEDNQYDSAPPTPYKSGSPRALPAEGSSPLQRSGTVRVIREDDINPRASARDTVSIYRPPRSDSLHKV